MAKPSRRFSMSSVSQKKRKDGGAVLNEPDPDLRRLVPERPSEEPAVLRAVVALAREIGLEPTGLLVAAGEPFLAGLRRELEERECILEDLRVEIGEEYRRSVGRSS
jgi:hypothetical protein